jgi:hypothetical protein
MLKAFRNSLGIYGRESYFVPVLMVIFGVFLMASQSSIEWGSLLMGFVVGAGVMGLLYRHVYRLTPVRKQERPRHE